MLPALCHKIEVNLKSLSFLKTRAKLAANALNLYLDCLFQIKHVPSFITIAFIVPEKWS